MKKFLGTLILSFLITTSAFAKIGRGDLKLDSWTIDKFIKYIKGKHSKSPELFIVSKDGTWSMYYYCGAGAGNCRGSASPGIKKCERATNTDCGLFARGRSIKWKNGINPGKGKASTIKSKWNDDQIRAKLTELGFLGGSISSTEITTPKITKKTEKKKQTKKVVKKYEIKGKRSIALSWDGYKDLIAGTVEFDEADYKGTLNIPLPNNDGTCDGSYSLQKGGKGTWQIACTNNMGAAGTLKWSETEGVTGKGRDHNDKKVKFTVSKKS